MADQLAMLRKGWDTLRKLPGGRRAFSALVGRTAPYTGTIGAQVLELEQGYARVGMADRPAVRNHLKSIHAIALANLVELTGNLALAYSLPPGSRFIVTAIEIEYLKKARGDLVGECRYSAPEVLTENVRDEVEVVVRDAAGDVVVRGRCKSQVGPVKG